MIRFSLTTLEKLKMTSRLSRPTAKSAPASAKPAVKPSTAGPGAAAAKASIPLFSLFLLAAFAQPAAAQQQAAQGQAEEPSSWGLGVGVGVERKPYRDFDNKTRLLPLLTYESKWISLSGLSADLKLPSAGPVSFRL